MKHPRLQDAKVALLLVLGLVCAASALYSDKSDVVKLTKENFAELVLNSDHVWFVEFYAPWCGHCKNLAPAWETAATNLKGIAKVGAINCDEERELAGLYKIQGFPTIKLFPSERTVKKGVPDKTPVDYNGARSAPAIVTFAHNSLPNFVSSSSASDFLEKPSDLNKVLLFSSKNAVSPLFKGLAIEFKDRLLFAQASSSDPAVSDFGVTEFPALFVINTNGEKTKFPGKIKSEEIIKFLTPFAPASSKAKSSSSSSSAKVEVRELKFVPDQNTLQSECYAKSGTCVIAFLDPSDENHSASIEILQTLVEKEKTFRFFWVDGTKNLKFANDLGVSTSFPQLAVVNPSKKLAGTMTTYFSADKISDYLGKVKMGAKRSVFSIDSLPSLDI